ncbi:MAG: glycosyltransferase family 4 protein [Myxococcota bacterium]|nr:glycosyltransferase family 4 protein [Myxococcota bacterium]
MQKDMAKMNRNRGIAFVGSYIPRQCGIATFTHDLAEAIAARAGSDQPIIVAAMNDRPGDYLYPDRVKFELRRDYQIDYSKAADFLNLSRIDVVCLQHEFNLFGGDWGANVLTLLRDLRKPVVVTCHSVQYNDDTPEKKEILSEIISRCDRVVVMNDRALHILEDAYAVSSDKLACIPHGIHDVPFVDPGYYKDKFAVEGRKLLLTFGLLHRDKGIQHVIEAMPKIIEQHQEAVYIILGATHPAIKRQEGESYRLSLERRVRALGLEEYVAFHPRFVELQELIEYLGATDILITPYLDMDRITSGVLAYAVGMGKAVISTPYWHAEELLADGRGKLVPPGDPGVLAQEVIGLLDDEVALNAMRKKAYMFSRNMIWSAAAQSYLRLFDEVRSHIPRRISRSATARRPIAAANVPLPKLDHLRRLTDDTGPCRLARHTLPDWQHGYSLADTSTALVACVKYHKMFSAKEAIRLSEIYLTLIQTLVGSADAPAAYLSYGRQSMGTASPDAIGKAIWALGYTVSEGSPHLATLANDMFQMLISRTVSVSNPGAGYSILGAAGYFRRYPGASEARRFLKMQSDLLEGLCVDPGWIARWQESDWPLAAQALTLSAQILERDGLQTLAHQLIEQISDVTEGGTVFPKVGDNPAEAEQPITAAAFIEALGAAFYVDRDPVLLKRIRSAADWFVGANRFGEALYDFSTFGCHDAITATGLNLNQGTRATAYCVLAFLTLHHLASATPSAGD